MAINGLNFDALREKDMLLQSPQPPPPLRRSERHLAQIPEPTIFTNHNGVDGARNNLKRKMARGAAVSNAEAPAAKKTKKEKNRIEPTNAQIAGIVDCFRGVVHDKPGAYFGAQMPKQPLSWRPNDDLKLR